MAFPFKPGHGPFRDHRPSHLPQPHHSRKPKSRALSRPKARKPLLEPLEPRLLLSSDLAYTALADADLTLRVQEVGGVEMLQIVDTHDAAAVLASQALAGIDGSSGFGARIDGNGHDIRLTIDTSVDAGRIAGGVIFDGGPGESTIIGPDRASTWKIGGTGSGEVDGIAFQGVERIVGGSDADTLVGPDTPTAWNYAKWTITGENSGSIGTTDFEGFENLRGGAGADLFVLNPGGGVSGRVEGGAGADSLKAGDGANEWAVQAADAGMLNGLAFQGIENLYGGAGADRFILGEGGRVGGVLSGGGGLDLISGTDVSGDWRVQGTNAGSVNGQAFKGIENLIGGAGADVFTFSGGGQVTGLIAGGAGADVLRASDADNTWDLTATNVGSLNGQVFSGIENLAGGAGVDHFRFADGAGVSGTLDGGAGENLLDYSAYAASVQVDLAAGTAGGTAGIGRIQNVTGGSGGDLLRGDTSVNRLIGGAGDDILIGGDGDLVEGGAGIDTLPGPAADATWNITGHDAGRVGGLTFSGIENLRGAAGNQDTFVLDQGGRISGWLEGGAGGFDTIVIGEGTYDTITFAPTGPDSGRIVLDGLTNLYSGFEPITGPAFGAVIVIDLTDIAGATATLEPDLAINTFKLTADDGGFETHTFTFLLIGTSVTINLGAGDDQLTLKNLGGTSLDDKLTVTGGAGDDTFKLDDDWGVGVTIVEGAAGGTDTLDFSLFSDPPTPRDWITIEPQLDGSIEINGEDGSSLALGATTAQNFEDLTGANINLTGLAGSVEDELVGGLKKMVSFMRDLAAVGQLASALPLIGKNADVAVAKALDLAESIDEIRLEVEEFFAGIGTHTTDSLIERLNDVFDSLTPRTLEHLGAAILSPLATSDAAVLAADNYDFNLTLDDGAPVNINATGAETVAELVAALNAELASEAATSGKVLAVARDGRIAFQAVGTEVEELIAKASGAGNEAVSKLGFGNNIPVTLSDIQGILQDLGDLKLSLASGVTLATSFEGGTPKLRLDVNYRANRESEFFYNLGDEAQSFGLAFDLQAAIAAKAELVFDFQLGLALDDASLDFFLDVDELRAGISTTLAAETVSNLGLNVGFLSAEVDGTLSLDAGVTVDTTSLQDVTDPAAISLSPSDLTLTGSNGTGSPAFDLNLTIGVNSSLDSLGGFAASGTLTASGNPFDGTSIDLSVGGSFDQFLDFNNLNAAGVISLLGQLGTWLDGLRDGDLFGSLDIPFIQGGFDKILDLAETLSDALLFDEGGDDQRDGSDALVTDLNQALADADLGDLIRAQADGHTITLVAIDPTITEFSIAKKIGNDPDDMAPWDGGGFADLGFANETSTGTPETIVANSAAVLFGPIAGRAGFTVSVTRPGGTINKDVRLRVDDTTNNTKVGDDTPKLVDAGNSATFATAQELAERLGQILAPGLVDYDTATNVLTYEIDFSDVPLFSVELPTDFSIDLSPLGSVSSDTRLIIDAQGGLHFTLGFDLSETPAGSSTLTDGTTLDSLGVDVKLEEAVAAGGAPRTIVGRLSGDAHLEVTITGGPKAGVYDVTLTKAATDNNAVIADLVSDLDAALAVAVPDGGGPPVNLTTEIDAQAVAGTDTLKLVKVGGMVTGLQVTTTIADPAFRELGFQESAVVPDPDDPGAPLVIEAAKNAPTLVGQLTGNALFDITFAGQSAKTVTVTQAATAANRNILDIIKDVQDAIDDSTVGPNQILVGSEGNRLLFTRVGATALGTGDNFTITPGANAGQLGITGSLTSDEADLVITTDDGTTKHRVVLDGVTDIAGLITAIETQTGFDVEVSRTADDPEGEATPVDETDTSLTLVDLTAPPDGGDADTDPDASGDFMVTTTNGSLAAIQLGLVGMDVNPNDASDSPDAKIVGAKISGATLLDRFFITGSDPNDPSTLGDVADATIAIKAGLVVEDIEIVSENGTDTVITSSSFEFKEAYETDNLHLVIKDVAGFNAGTYQIDAVNEGTNQATITKVGPAGVAGEMGQEGGVGILESGVRASANFGFVGIELSGTADLGAELSLGFNTNAAPLADGKLTLQELINGLGNVLDLVAPPDLTPISPATDFGGLSLSVDVPFGSGDLSAGDLLPGGAPSVSIEIVTPGDPFLGTRFEQAAYAQQTGTQFTLTGDLRANLPDGATIRFSGGSGDRDFVIDSTSFGSGVTTVNVTAGGAYALPVSLATYDVVLMPKVNISHTDLGNLLNFDDIGFDDILAALQALANFLGQFESFGFLNQDLPIIDQSVNDLLGFAGKFLDAVEEAESNPAGTLQLLEGKINEAIGIAAPQLLDFFNTLKTGPMDEVLGYASAPNDVLDLSLVGGDILKFDLALGAGFSKGLDFALPGLDFGDTLAGLGLGNILDLSGSAGLFAEGSVMLRLQIGVDLTNPSQIYLFEDSGIEAELEVGGENLAFKVGVGPFSLSIGTPDPDIMPSGISLAATAGVHVNPAAFDGEGKVLLSTALGSLQANLAGTAMGELPVFFPTDAQQLGTIKIGEDVQPGFGNLAHIGNLVLQTEASPTPAPTSNDFVIDVHEVIDGIADFDFAAFDLFTNIFLAIDGLDLLLGEIQTLVDDTLGASSVPLIGNDIAKAADFIQDLRDDFIAPLREALETAKNAAQDFADADKNILSKAIFDLLGPAGIGLLRKQGAGTGVGDYVGLNTNLDEFLFDPESNLQLKDTFVEWDLKLGQDPFVKSADIGFDLGIPGLGLETEGDIQLMLQWELDLTFGLSGTDGFYFRVDDPHELLFDISVTLPGAGIKGTLGFLELRAHDTTLMVDGQNRNTELGATFKVDISESGASGNGADGVPDAQRLGFTELGSIAFDAGIAAEAAATLGLELGLSGDLLGEIFGGGASSVVAGFPKVVGDFVFLWELGSRASGPSLEAIANASTFQGFDDFSTNSIADGLKLVAFQDVGLDLGSFLGEVLGPIVDEVSKYTEPLQPIIDFITSPVPIIGQLGLDITWLDLAKALAGDSFNVELIESLAEIITLINDIAELSSAGEVILPIGDMEIYNNLGTFVPNVNLWDPKASTADLFNELDGAGQLLGSFAEGQVGAALEALAGGLSGDEAATANTLKNVTSGQAAGGFAFPFLDDPGQIFGLLLGKEVDLITYDLGAFEFKFEFSQFFSIFGPLGVSIGLIVEIMADTAFGYDTLGIRQFVESGFRNPGLLFNGFFISDSPKLDGNDDPELTFGAELVAAAELNLGIAKAGVAASLGFQILFDLFDPNSDGKVRFTEIAGNIANQLKSDEPFLAPLAMFDVSGEIFARLFAFLEINLGFFTFEEEFPIFGPVTLLSFEIDFFRPPVLASEVASNGDLLLHSGEFADQRLLGNATDIAEHLIIQSNGTDGDYVNVQIKSGNGALGEDSQTFLDYKVKKGSRIIIDGGEGDDTFDLSGFTENQVLFEIDGGAGNDTITLGSGAGVAGKFSSIKGGSGDDVIQGSGGTDLIFGGTGGDTIDGGEGQDLLFGDEGEIATDRVRGLVRPSDAVDIIDGQGGSDIIIGSGGRDDLSGGDEADLILGGGGFVVFTGGNVQKTFGNLKSLQNGAVGDTENLVQDATAGDTIHGNGGADILFGTAGPDALTGDAGNDTIFGMSGFDTIDAGAGNDTVFGDGGQITAGGPQPTEGGAKDEIQGGAGEDTIFGGGGGDVIQGGADNDVIRGGAGPDVIFGDNGGFVGNVPTPNNMMSDGDDVILGEGEPDRIFGGGGIDQIDGGAGPDIIKGGPNSDLIIANKSNDSMDGEGGDDTYLLSFQGGKNVSLQKVFDSGPVSDTDLFVANGTVFNDQFLLRANNAGTLAFVALVNSEFHVERINYNKSIERIVVNGSLGLDNFAVDDSVSDITLNGELGDDTFQVGQLFRDERVVPNVLSVDDEFATIETTRGFLSNGISAPMTINGGLGNDYFRVFHNKAVLQLNGDEGDDTFEIRAFALAGSQEPERERTDISGGAGVDLVQYAVNAPVNIDGGDGFDTLIVIGTEFGDDFVVTEDGVYGAGLNVNFVNIESLRVDGAEGDDRFYVKSTSEKFVTELFGGLGDDTFSMSGDTPPIVSNDLLGHSGLAVHGVESVDPRYDGQKVFGISANVADNDEPFAVIRQTGGSTIVDEGSSTFDTYEVVLTRKPDTEVLIKVLAPIPTPDGRERRAMAFRVDSPTEFDPLGDGDDNGSVVVLKFTPFDWYVPQTVQVSADATLLHDTTFQFTRPELGDGGGVVPIDFTMDDPAAEGLRYGVINHLVQAQSAMLQGVLVAIDNAMKTATIVDDGSVAAGDLLGQSLEITGVPGFGQSRTIVGVTDLGPNFLLTLDREFDLNDVPSTTSQYTIRIDDSFIGIMTSFQEDAFVGLDPDDKRSTFEDSGASFPTVGQGLVGATLEIIGGPGAGQQRLILGHVEGFETTRLILNGPWRTDPVANESIYRIKRYDGLALPSVLVQVNDNDKAGLVVDETQGFEDGDLVVTAADITDDYDTITALIEGGDGDHLGEQDIVRVRLTKDPGATSVEVGLLYDAAQIMVTDLAGTAIDAGNPLVFTSGNWSVPQPVLVKGLTDLTREGFHSGLIQFDISAGSSNATGTRTDDFVTVPADTPVFFVGLTERPVAGTVTVTLDTVELTEADADGLNGQYLVLSNKIVFVDATGDPVAVSGDIEVSYDYVQTGFLGAFTPPVLARMTDADAPAVVVRESGDSTDVIELRRGGGDPDSIPEFSYDLIQFFNASPWNDSYELLLSGQPTDDVTVTVTPEVTKTTRTGGIRHDAVQIVISSDDSRAVADGANLIVSFDETNWDDPVVIKVAALDDAVVDGSDTQVFAPGPNAVSGILGPVVIDGAGGQGSLNIGRPVMLPGEINVKDKTGDVAAPVSGTHVTVHTADLTAILDDFGLLDVGDLEGKTIEITGVNDAEDLFHSAIGQFRLITLVTSAAGLTTLHLNEPFDLNLGDNTGETEADIKSYAITMESLNFFVDETTQVDFMFVHDEDSPADHSGVLTPTRLYGLNMGPDLVIGGQLRPGGITYGNLEVIEVNLGTGNNTFNVLGTPTRRDDGYQTWTFLNTGDDIEWQGVQGDTVIVKLNEDDVITATGTVTSAQNADANAAIYKNTVTIDQMFADDALAGQVIRIVDDGLGENDGEADNQERRIIGNDGNVLWVDRPWEFIPDGEAYDILNEADGAFAVNTEGGDDTVDASASTLGITMFGGLGQDDLTGGSGADAIFGDRGRVDYFDENGGIVTRLGEAPEPITGFVTTQVTPMTLTTLVDSGASFPLPDNVADGAGTDDIGLRGLYVDINNGKGFRQTVRLITGNTADTLTITPGFDTDEDLPGPDVDEPSEYRISTMPENQTDGVVRDPGLLLTLDNDLGAMDTIDAGAGADQVFGGAGGDDIAAGADDDLVVGDAGRLDRSRDPEASGRLVVHRHDEGRVEVKSFYDRLRTIAWDEGGQDTLAGEAGADIILGGSAGDTLYGDDPAGSSADADLADAILGDNGEFDFDDGVVANLFTTDVIEATGGADTVHGNAGGDVVLGGVNGSADTLHGDGGDDTLLGDNGEVLYDVDSDLATLDLIRTTGTDRGGDDEIHGNAGHDIMLGATGADRMFGDEDEDLALGDFGVLTIAGGALQRAEMTDRTLGGPDTIYGGTEDDLVAGGAFGDRLDGDAGDDLIFGDNLVLDRQFGPGATTNPRYRALTGSLLYDAQGNVLVDRDAQYDNPVHVPAWADWDFTLFDHSFADEAAGLDNFGDDYIAGGPDDDTIFAMLGDDIVQGDGSIDSLDMGGTGVSAHRDGSGMLVINPSFEDDADGDDYIEGNGGGDVIFGNLGQDDIIGGSSSQFSLATPARRPDGADLIFGGAGTAAGRNHDGDLDADGHARDADMILADNGNIFRLVGLNGAGSGAYLTFNYDNYVTGLRIVPRAADLIDYTPGGADVDPILQATDIGAADEVHGEAGDDAVYGMKGPDVLFGDGQDDDLVGGYGHDWFSGGTGQDGIIGDDGRILTSRNIAAGTGGASAYSEPLYGVLKVDQVNKLIDTPGDIQTAVINVAGQLKKTVNLEPFHLTPTGQADDPLRDPADADDVIYGGLGGDFLHGGAGDDAMSGAEALPQFFAVPFNPGNVLRFGQVRAEEFAAYNEFKPLRQVFVDDAGEFVENPEPGDSAFLLNFDATEGPLVDGSTTIHGDGDDRMFGDLGNDWIVGGTGRDHLFGGWGSDLLNADDDHDSTAGGADPLANDVPDTHATYEDIAYGGAGRDYLIANTGGDRLIDWVGEYNSYLVPFAPYGIFTISRMLQPQLPEYLHELSASGGADPTRAADSGGDPLRNGEPDGELGMVLQKDFAWQDQTGAPDDPQAGNIPGGPRDVLRGADFNQGTMSAFAPDSGSWVIEAGALKVSAWDTSGDAVSVFHVDSALPSYFEVLASINAGKPTKGWKANAFIIFDYQNETDFKFAGVNASLDKLQMGHRTPEGWIVDVQAPAQVRPETFYNMMVAVHGTNVTLLVDNTTIFSHTFTPRLVDGRTVGLNEGMVGVGSLSARGLFDNVRVQKVPPAITLQWTDDFGDGAAERFRGATTGGWQVLDGRYQGAPAAGAERATNLIDLGLPKGLAPTSVLELEARLSTQGTGGFVFDQYGPDDFKFVGIDTAADRVIIGHHTTRGGWVTDAFASRALEPGRDYRLSVSLRGTSVSVSLDGQVVAGHVFNGVVVDGGFGLLARSGAASFDSVTMRTDDRAFAPVVAGDSSTSLLSTSSSGALSASLVYDGGASTDLSAADGGADTDAVTLPDYLVHDWVVESKRNGNGAGHDRIAVQGPRIDFDGLAGRRNDRGDDEAVDLGGDWLMIGRKREAEDLLF